ncbi:MAG: glutaminyl-peptide cyclotransferase [Acidimicrobiaceae bacterium]|nr:glutaminyl-peptide cyclotransferase [Acidimicrobiaceae bacterium]
MPACRSTSVILVLTLWLAACGGDRASSDNETTLAGIEPVLATQRWPRRLDTLDPNAPARWGVEVLDRFPHDAHAFTQGLEALGDGTLLESTGLRGESTIRIVDPTTGVVLDTANLADEEFGEGATVVDDTIVQLTWQSGRARRWHLSDLTPLEPWAFEGEGWGLCLLGDRLAMSDGSATLTFRDPHDFAILEQVTVTFEGDDVTRLNELECVDGHVIANIWQSPTIIVIRPDGRAVATIDGTPLIDEIGSTAPSREVLNGIAVRDETSFWLTGKQWPTLFVIGVAPDA